MPRKKLTNFFILGFVVIIAIVVGFVLPRVNVPNVDTSISSSVTEEIDFQTLSLEFDSGDEILKFNDVEINRGENLFGVLQRVTEQNAVEFSYKDFGGDLGIFIESINNSSQQESKTKWWQYWIDGEYAQVGVLSYQVKSGDNIIFKFTDDLEVK